MAAVTQPVLEAHSRGGQAGRSQEAAIIDSGPTDPSERSRIHRLLASAVPRRRTEMIARAVTHATQAAVYRERAS